MRMWLNSRQRDNLPASGFRRIFFIPLSELSPSPTVLRMASPSALALSSHLARESKPIKETNGSLCYGRGRIKVIRGLSAMKTKKMNWALKCSPPPEILKKLNAP